MKRSAARCLDAVLLACFCASAGADPPERTATIRIGLDVDLPATLQVVVTAHSPVFAGDPPGSGTHEVTQDVYLADPEISARISLR